MSETPPSAEQLVALEREARRIYERYEVEVVEGFGFCPWAERARREGEVEVRIVLEDDASLAQDLGPALAAVEAHAARDHVAVGLVVFPRVSMPRDAFARFVAELRERHADAHGRTPPMALAEFHPDAPADLGAAARLVPFLRRSPDPTIQCVRLSVLSELRRGEEGTDFIDLSTTSLAEILARPVKKPLHERVAERNLETVCARGTEAIEAVLADIAADRAAAYARVLGAG
ncbi:MAG: DUF1415 family protein [Sandaracinus sp.]|nr:DUF1415 family protein [Sandaracinus sp.]MCB9621890.1 DUF1415 family protein [Sandaracinus sp.]